MDHKNLTLRAFGKLQLSTGLVLDVGCYDTSLKPFFERQGFEWIGCDRYKNDDVDECDMDDLPYVDDKFEVVFVCHSFEHTERPAETLREFKRVLKPGGTLFISTPVHCDHQIMGADIDHINVLTPQQMARFMTYTGFKLEDIWIEENESGDVKDNSMITVCIKEE